MGKVLHASGSGWFPDCLAVGISVGTGNYPIGMSLKQGMEIYWRVRKWDVSIGSSYSNQGGAGAYSVFFPNAMVGTFQKDYTASGQTETVSPVGLPPSSEEQLVCNPRYAQIYDSA